MTSSRHLGLDLGGTNIKWAVVDWDGSTWTTMARGQVPTDVSGDPLEVPRVVVAQLAGLAVGSLVAWGDLASVGIGVPGRYDPATGQTRFLVNVPGPWAAMPVARPVAEAARAPAFLINDARAFGLAELRMGAGRGTRSMVGVTLGTGVGGVVAIDGRVYLGHDGTAGELGHQTIEPNGLACNCGNCGCVEAYVRADRICAVCGTASVKEAVRRARDGDARAMRGLEQVGRYLGIGLANIITVISPDRVVVGGGVAAAGELLFAPIREEIARRVTMTSLDEVELVQAELGTWAGSIGAAIHGAERMLDA